MPSVTAIVTGGTQGLGRAIALALARRGMRVLALYHRDHEAARDLDRVMAESGLDGRALQHDVTDPRDDAPAWRAPEIERADRLVLVHNAGAPFTPQPFHLVPWDDFQRCFDVAVRGAWACARALLRPMLSTGEGRIATILSTATHGLPPKGFAAYAAAKSALRSLTLSLAAEYGARGLRICSISPGFMDTALTRAWPPALREAVGRHGATDAPTVAERVAKLLTMPDLPGRGEDYVV
jgi:NAD(P)-dependent dehydrogenase (short-subunit alcohol dehydrogenase family)